MEPIIAEQSAILHKLRGMSHVVKQLTRIADAIEAQTRIGDAFNQAWLAYNRERDKQPKVSVEEHLRAEEAVQASCAVLKEVEVLRALGALGRYEEVLQRAGVFAETVNTLEVGKE